MPVVPTTQEIEARESLEPMEVTVSQECATALQSRQQSETSSQNKKTKDKQKAYVLVEVKMSEGSRFVTQVEMQWCDHGSLHPQTPQAQRQGFTMLLRLVSDSWAQATCTARPPKVLGLQVCTTIPGPKMQFLREIIIYAVWIGSHPGQSDPEAGRCHSWPVPTGQKRFECGPTALYAHGPCRIRFQEISCHSPAALEPRPAQQPRSRPPRQELPPLSQLHLLSSKAWSPTPKTSPLLPGSDGGAAKGEASPRGAPAPSRVSEGAGPPDVERPTPAPSCLASTGPDDTKPVGGPRAIRRSSELSAP
ncbi:hypothetical protein AAY473_039882 [Plecturocebus cupreus]